ncbi:hypothetical protein Ocin01_17404 [Orchesella cincta]|uniref:CUB domain-containing protein n=1 Tax=Orchesella cincta TaxID=48709 RepID=A0A1D2M8H4_ORCCI|nr:hypothetical protein Ocin01_17404 [Orchesella cincta]
MKLSISTFLIILGTVAVPSFALPNSAKEGVPSPTYVDCGGVLNATSATISHKANATISQNERCVWTLRSTTAVSYTLNVQSFGLKPEVDNVGLRVTCIAITESSIRNYSDVQISETGTVSLEPICHVLFLTFYTGGNVENSQGFSITYTEIPGPSPFVAATSKHYVFNTAQSNVYHPPDIQQPYTNYELSTFIFAPLNNSYNPERQLVVTYVENSLGTECKDYVVPLTFGPSSGWTELNRLCEEDTFEQFDSDDMIMMIFISGDPPAGRGFVLGSSYD